MTCADAELPEDDDPKAVRAALAAADQAVDPSSKRTAGALNVVGSAPKYVLFYLVVEFLLDLLRGAL